MKAPVSWLREFADLPASASVAGIAERIAGVGFEVAGLEGEVIDFEITANRPDCLSIRGLAREAAAAYGVQGPAVLGSGGPAVLGSGVPVTIESDLCGRYALALADVKVGASPAWLANRLAACGVRPSNNVVDVTNYVMLETGQPLHAFDVARLAGPEIRVRMARAGETLTTLDGQARTLDAAMLVIADRDRAVAVAGVMGGAPSEVSASTTRIALESAYFQPAPVRAASKRMGLKTEASSRFERGADPAAAVTALARALDLFEQIGAGRRVGGVTDVHPAPVAGRTVTLQRAPLDRLLGDVVPDADVARILASLGFVAAPAAGGWDVRVPTWRVDVAREADLIEEVGRHWGVNRVPATFPALHTAPRRSNAAVLRARRIRRLLCGAGLQEAVTFTFIEQAAASLFVAEPASLVSIANPLSEKFAVLRPSMLPGLLDALVYNRRRDLDDVRLFEAGAVFSTAGERQRVGWVLCGARLAHWSQPPAAVDLYDALGVAGVLTEAYTLACHTEPATDAPWFVPGRAAAVIADCGTGPQRIGTVGQLRPEIVDARGLSAGIVIAGELDVDVLRDTTVAGRRVTPLPRHPAAIRDLSILIDAGLPAAAVRATIRAHAPASLVEVREFDRYQGKGIPDGQISLSVRLTFQERDRTLTDAEVQQAVEIIVDALAGTHGAALRH
ncbi:MAG: phenylalanine--tRNA ligase subunit beta [Acidobacteria bacterium]|nr:phenylalanine--tRNA ligase subunit beta [Acidobacteriota bacterium]